MIENKRYVTITDTNLEISIKDNLTKKYPFSLLCENLDEFEPLLNEVINVCAEMNKSWEQTQRFEDHNKRLIEENEQLKSELNIYRKVANCYNCEFHTYEWYDDGDEFEVCKKGNDMWYRICEEWSEFDD